MDLITIVNKKDHILGYKPKEEVHKGSGILHRAITVFIFNKKGELLIARRSKNKKRWPLFWETTCSTDVTKKDVIEGEEISIPKASYIIAAKKRLKAELGIDCQPEFLFKFHYKERYKNKQSENEICALLTATYNRKAKLNKKEIKEVKYIPLNELKQKIKSNPKKYTPWLKIALQKYLEEAFSINDYINETNQVVDDFTLKFLKKLKQDKDFPYKAVSHLPVLRMGVPKVRCVLLRLIYESIKPKEDWEEILPLAAALELYGNSTYVLDDIFDNQHVRIGDSATWKKFGLSKAIIAGIIQRDIAARMASGCFKNNPKDKTLDYFEEMDYFLYIGQYLNEDLLEESSFKDYERRTRLISIDPYYFSKIILDNLKISKKKKELLNKLAYNWRYLAMIRNDFMNLSLEEIKRKSKTKMLQGKTFEDLKKGLWVWPIIYFFKKAKTKSMEKKFIKAILGNRNAKEKDLLRVVRILIKTNSLKAFLEYIRDRKKETINLIKDNMRGFEKKKWLDFIKLTENINVYYREMKKLLK